MLINQHTLQDIDCILAGLKIGKRAKKNLDISER